MLLEVCSRLANQRCSHLYSVSVQRQNTNAQEQKNINKKQGVPGLSCSIPTPAAPPQKDAPSSTTHNMMDDDVMYIQNRHPTPTQRVLPRPGHRNPPAVHPRTAWSKHSPTTTTATPSRAAPPPPRERYTGDLFRLHPPPPPLPPNPASLAATAFERRWENKKGPKLTAEKKGTKTNCRTKKNAPHTMCEQT